MSERFLTALRLKGTPEGYAAELPVVRHLAVLGELELGPVTILVGENGVGKSTLLEAVAAAAGFNPEGGSVNFRFATAETHSALYRSLTLCRGVHRPRDGFFLRAESFYNVASSVDELAEQPGGGDFLAHYGGKSLHAQSHGESFLALVQHRFGPGGLYLMDEPEAALSPMRQLTLLAELYRLARQGSQLLLSTHSPILMAFPDAWLYELREDGIRRVSWQETEHVRVTRQFLSDPARLLHYLLED